MSAPSSYHLNELAIIRDARDPRRCVPSYDCAGWKVLDIGCGIGQTLTASEFEGCAERHGIDVDANAIEAGLRMFPALTLKVAPAESIPYPAGYFDLTFSRVALPYTNLPRALDEIRRVTRPGGHVWLSLHPWSMERRMIADALRGLSLRRLVDRAYVVSNSTLLHLLGKCYARPWSGQYESIQQPSGVRRLLAQRGFLDIQISNAEHFFVTARRGH